MQPNDKAMIKSKLAVLAGQVSSCQGMVMSAKGMASVPLVTAMGPVAAPGLIQLSIALEQQNQLDDQIVKFLNLLVDKL